MAAPPGLLHAVRRGLLAAAFAAALAAPAHAFTITNADPEHRAKVSIDYWLRWVKAGESVVFRPEAFPVTVYVQYPLGTISCEATSDSDEVVISSEQCLVNGELAGKSTLRF